MDRKLKDTSELLHSSERAIWQRSEGMMLIREVSEAIYTHLPERLTNTDTSEVDNTEPVFDQAADAANIYIKEFISIAQDDVLPHMNLKLQDTSAWTFAEELRVAMQEAAKSSVIFPVNFIRVISELPQTKDEFKLDSLSDIAVALRRNDIRRLIDQSALSGNGFWQDFSTDQYELSLLYRTERVVSVLTGILFDEESRSVHYNSVAQAALRDFIRDNNRFSHEHKRESVTPMYRGASAGCPARFRKPSQALPISHSFIADMATAFGKSPEQLVEKREKNPIEIGLDIYTDFLDLLNNKK